jgi:hypothetical protein
VVPVAVASRVVLCSVRVVRGAPAWLPALRSKPCAAQRVSVLQIFAGARYVQIPGSKTGIDKVLARKVNGLRVLSPTVACAGRSATPSSQPRATYRSLVQLRRCN